MHAPARLSAVKPLPDPSQLGRSQCDAFSLAYLGPAVLVGTGFAALSVWTVEFQRSRFKLYGLLALAGATCAAVLGINPSCFGGFYSEALWLNFLEGDKICREHMSEALLIATAFDHIFQDRNGVAKPTE